MVKSIIVVDDDAELREVIGQLLQANGWSVTTAGDGLEALGLVQVMVPTVVLADLEMPNMGGLELMRVLHQLPQPPRVLLMSGRQWKRGKAELGVGEHCFLNKPLSAAQLLSALEKIGNGEEGLSS